MERKGKGLLIALLVCILATQNVMAQVNNDAVYDIGSNGIADWPQGPDIYSDTGVLMEAQTGEVLYDKGMNEARYPASTTKVMTALLALEQAELSDEVTFSASALENMYLGTNIGMQEGEVLTMDQALSVMMIKSANEVANQIGEYIGGSQEGFATMMNERAAELGCKNTHFVNASGMPDDNHYSTAYDMALIFRKALKNKKFRQLISMLSYTLEPTNMNPESRSFSNAHAVFVPNVPEHYEGCLGGKTGVTNEAGNTLVTGVKRDGLTYIAMVMRADGHGQVCADTSALFDYGYNNFEMINEKEGHLVAPKNAGDKITSKEQEIDKGIKKTYYYGEHTLGTEVIKPPKETPTVTESIEEAGEEDAPEKKPISEPIVADETTLKIAIIILGGLIFLGLILIGVRVAQGGKKKGRK